MRIRITAPPVDGKANAHIVGFVAKVFGVPKRRVRLVRGERSRDKELEIDSPARIPTQLAGCI